MSNWTALTAIPSSNWGMGFGVVDGLLYLTRGTTSIRIYTPGTNAWTTGTNAAPRDWFASASGVVAGKLYFAGSTSGGLNHCGSYDPATDTWASLANMTTGRFSAGGVGAGGLFYVAGGDVGGPDSHVATFQAYDPSTDSWATLASMPDRRKDPSLIELDGLIYAAGGSTDGGTPNYDSLYVYDPSTDSWATLASMPEARHGVSLAVFDDKIYVAGGRDAADTFGPDDTYRYTPATDTWETLGADDDIPYSRGLSGYGVIDGSLYVAGGFSGGGAVARLDRYTPALGRGWVLGPPFTWN